MSANVSKRSMQRARRREPLAVAHEEIRPARHAAAVEQQVRGHGIAQHRLAEVAEGERALEPVGVAVVAIVVERHEPVGGMAPEASLVELRLAHLDQRQGRELPRHVLARRLLRGGTVHELGAAEEVGEPALAPPGMEDVLLAEALDQMRLDGASAGLGDVEEEVARVPGPRGDRGTGSSSVRFPTLAPYGSRTATHHVPRLLLG